QCVVLALLLAVSSSQGGVKMIATPVVYTNGDGGGADEVQAFPDRGNYKLFDAGNTVCAAWWVPFDNIPDVSTISQIYTQPSGTQVKLNVQGVVRTGRVRIMIYADLC
ncbi:hypothetical protein, partial [Pseudophaeobacter profundi]|uniref:hypothetical protein n=1 Tax=Pseudophaeobacter profundi TaxID=3034152 RepID=UPI002430A1FC